MKMKKIICLVLIVALAFPLCACGDEKKKEVYNEFVALVEEERFDAALEYFNTAYEESSVSYFDDFKLNYEYYKDFDQYYEYAYTLNKYRNVKYKDLGSVYTTLQELPNDFLSTSKYLEEIELRFKDVNGVYQNNQDDSNFLIIIDGYVWMAAGLSIDDLIKVEFKESAENVLTTETVHYTLSEYCQNVNPEYKLYLMDSDKYIIGISNNDTAVIIFNLDAKTRNITSTDECIESFQGTYIKTDYLL